jgi:FkbM family methyltransferase
MDLMQLMYKGNKKYSQSGQDAFVIHYFQNKRNGVFIDIGANDGVDLSNTYYLEKELGWSGICFEPIPAIFEKLDKNRNCIKIMAGVAEKESTEKFIYVDGPSHMLSGMLKEYDPRHLQRVNNEVQSLGGKIVELELKCVVLNDVLEQYKFYDIDYLSLDTEGNEFKILKTIDFDKFNIKTMTIENNYNNVEQTNYVLSKGYYCLGRLEADEIFVKIKK